MASKDAFALGNSPFNPLLYAEVGIEENGAALTVLSVLARLDEDPWSEAARWAWLPKATVIDQLTARLEQMPLCPDSLRDARRTATRLSALLPPASPLDPQPLPKWAPMAAFCCAIIFGMALNLLLVHAQPLATHQIVTAPLQSSRAVHTGTTPNG
jgi:hypothetical protein